MLSTKKWAPASAGVLFLFWQARSLSNSPGCKLKIIVFVSAGQPLFVDTFHIT